MTDQLSLQGELMPAAPDECAVCYAHGAIAKHRFEDCPIAEAYAQEADERLEAFARIIVTGDNKELRDAATRHLIREGEHCNGLLSES